MREECLNSCGPDVQDPRRNYIKGGPLGSNQVYLGAQNTHFTVDLLLRGLSANSLQAFIRFEVSLLSEQVPETSCWQLALRRPKTSPVWLSNESCLVLKQVLSGWATSLVFF
jgi:hypothetical protein